MACVAGVRKGRRRELGRETRARIPPFPSPFNACHAGYGAYFRHFTVCWIASQAYPRSYYFYFHLNIWFRRSKSYRDFGERGPCPYFTNFASQWKDSCSSRKLLLKRGSYPQYLWSTFYLELQIDENEVVKPEYHAEVFPYPGNVCIILKCLN